MPNTLDGNGLTVKTQDELVAEISAALQDAYGADINLSPDTPDGQLMMSFIAAILDVEDLVFAVYASMDPDQAVGKVLDQRAAINGIQRQAGTHTTTNIVVVTTQPVTLYGTDQNVQPVYTIADNAGNRWQVITSINLPTPGSNNVVFQAENPGAVLTVPNTITVPITIILGVQSVNNPTSYLTLGINEETDAEFKLRRQRSVSLSSQGYLQGLLAALLNLTGMVSAFVYENNTAVTDGDGIPAHSIWVITSGTADSAEIANAIYTKRNAGCGMKGTQTFVIVQADGSNFTIRWDVVVLETLYIKFTATSLDGVNAPDLAAIRPGLVTSFTPGVFEQVNVNDLGTAVQNIDNNTLVTLAGFGSAPTGPFTNTKTPSAKNRQFAVTAPNIIIIPMLLSPSAPTVSPTTQRQFTAYGGFGAYTWSMDASPSGGSVNPAGLYAAGVTPATDIIRATDAQGNFVTANILVQ